MIRPAIALAILASLTACAASPTRCAAYLGIAAHPTTIDAPDHNGPNPLAQIGGECRRGRLAAFAEHESAIFYRERGAGWNVAGVRWWSR
jgi:hypothetical protein